MAKENFRAKPKKGHASKARGKVSPGQPNMNTMNRNPNLRTPGSAKSLLGTGQSFSWNWNPNQTGFWLMVQPDCYSWDFKCRCDCRFGIHQTAVTPDWMNSGWCQDDSGLFQNQPIFFVNQQAELDWHLTNIGGSFDCTTDSDCHSDCIQACTQFGMQNLSGTCHGTPHGGY